MAKKNSNLEKARAARKILTPEQRAERKAHNSRVRAIRLVKLIARIVPGFKLENTVGQLNCLAFVRVAALATQATLPGDVDGKILRKLQKIGTAAAVGSDCVYRLKGHVLKLLVVVEEEEQQQQSGNGQLVSDTKSAANLVYDKAGESTPAK